MTAHSAEDRLHALDAVRGFALLAGVWLHAAMSYLPGFDAWPLLDTSPSETLAVSFFVIHMFRMTTFFLIAGFFGRMLLYKQGVRAFVRNRTTRVIVPLVVGWMVFFPMIATALVLAAGNATPPAPSAGAMQRSASSFPWAHLWFLYVLTLLYAGTLLVRQGLVERIDRAGRLRGYVDRGVRASLQSSLMPLLLAAPLVAAFMTSASWVKWGGIPTPDQSLIPNLPAFVGFGTAFTFGWLLQRQTQLLHVLEGRWALHLSVAVVLTAVSLLLVDQRQGAVAPRWDDLTLPYATAYAVGLWAWTFGIIGVALRFFAGPSAVRRYVADSSYWIYLAHLPLIFFLQLLLKDVSWHWSLKFPIVVITATTLLFFSYHYLVRFTFVGETLNGRRYRHRPPDSGGAATPATPPDVLATLSNAFKRYGKTLALDGLSLDIRKGELLALLGPNGAGKSTAISLLLGLQEPDAGSAQLFGRQPSRLEARQQVGIMMQEVGLAPELRVRELIDLTTTYYPAPLTVPETLELTHTTSLADRPYGTLSAGQKRQVQFALAVCGRPALLFLDEPTVGLDVQAREMLWATLRTLIAQGSSIVLTTHYLEEAESLAHRVAVLAKGRLIATGSVDEMRGLVARRRIRCRTRLMPDEVRAWPGVVTASLTDGYLQVVSVDADAVVRRLLRADEEARDLEVQRAGLAEAFTELTQEAA
ncbi:MAG TPA: ATP-binding cassette domain-containing protein [Vicinamibacterales bacterium]|nr:ATP-binding cassette domain-containing protein [Vicinamibacterales bacterium]